MEGRRAAKNKIAKALIYSACILAILPLAIDDQNIYDDDVDVTAVRRMIGMVFQRPNPFPTMSIYDNVVAGLKLNGVRKKSVLDDAAEQNLRSANLWEEVKDRLDRPGAGLSGGQQQRLCIARTIAVEPQVVLMDEPCSALDPISTMAIEDLMFKLKDRFTIIIVTHNMQQAARVSDRTGFFSIDKTGDPGRLIEYDDTQKIFSNPDREEDRGLHHRPIRLSLEIRGYGESASSPVSSILGMTGDAASRWAEAVTTSRTRGYERKSFSVDNVGGSMARPLTAAGLIQSVPSDSPDTSRAVCPSGSRAKKNHVSYRRGSNSGVIHRDHGKSRSSRSRSPRPRQQLGHRQLPPQDRRAFGLPLRPGDVADDRVAGPGQQHPGLLEQLPGGRADHGLGLLRRDAQPLRPVAVHRLGPIVGVDPAAGKGVDATERHRGGALEDVHLEPRLCRAQQHDGGRGARRSRRTGELARPAHHHRGRGKRIGSVTA